MSAPPCIACGEPESLGFCGNPACACFDGERLAAALVVALEALREIGDIDRARFYSSGAAIGWAGERARKAVRRIEKA